MCWQGYWLSLPNFSPDQTRTNMEHMFFSLQSPRGYRVYIGLMPVIVHLVDTSTARTAKSRGYHTARRPSVFVYACRLDIIHPDVNVLCPSLGYLYSQDGSIRPSLSQFQGTRFTYFHYHLHLQSKPNSTLNNPSNPSTTSQSVFILNV